MSQPLAFQYVGKTAKRSYESSRNSIDGSLPLTPVSGTGQALPSPPGLGERAGVRGFMRVKTNMGTFI
jgi:hypothetical protein